MSYQEQQLKNRERVVLRLEDVCKAFGGVVAAQDVSFDVKAGSIMGLIGPNGAGKTTILNVVSGIYPVDDGKVYIEGADVTKLPAHTRARLGLARTFQSPRFLQRSNIRDNMLLGTDLAEQLGFWRSFWHKKGLNFQEELLELMEVAGFPLRWDAEISSLPYGQLKLLEIVRAMLSHPRVMLVDEPAAGLNSKEIDRVVALLQLATDKHDIGVVLIEHRMDMVMNTCHDIVVLNFGRLIAHGAPEEISINKDVIEAYLGRGYNAEN